MYVGEHVGQSTYRITSRKKRLVVHNGMGKTDPALASLIHKSFFGPGTGAVIPPIGRGRPIALDKKYGFTCQVPAPDGNGTRAESFEWRKSKGMAVNKLTGKNRGYKLVRMATDVGQQGGEIATGGGEVVAIMSRHAAFAWTRAGQMAFVGAGARGELGDIWQLVAGMTAIGIWDFKRRAESGPSFTEA